MFLGTTSLERILFRPLDQRPGLISVMPVRIDFHGSLQFFGRRCTFRANVNCYSQQHPTHPVQVACRLYAEIRIGRKNQGLAKLVGPPVGSRKKRPRTDDELPLLPPRPTTAAEEGGIGAENGTGSLDGMKARSLAPVAVRWKPG